jgi:hypothetical protein
MKSIITISDDFGNSTTYKRMSARIPEFLTRYPLGPGQYSMDTKFIDALSLQPGRLRLFEVAIQSGAKNLRDLGMQHGDDTWMVCTRSLIDKDGRKVADGTAAKLIIDYKDLEKLESAATQRLLAMLGFGGEVLDADEENDINAQGLKTAADDAKTGGVPTLPLKSEVEKVQTVLVGETTETSIATTLEKPTVVVAATLASTPTVVMTENLQGVEQAPAALIRQVEKMAERLEQPAITLASKGEACAELSRLSKIDRDRRQQAKQA